MGIRNFDVVTMGQYTAERVLDVTDSPGVMAIPPMQSGKMPKFVFLKVLSGTVPSFLTVTPTMGGNGDITKGIPLVCWREGVILNVSGYTHIGHESWLVGPYTLYIVPLEDF